MPDDNRRISDAERDRTISAVSEHYALGRLDLEELNERTSQALAARTQGQLVAVLTDLPALPSIAAASPAPARRPELPLPAVSAAHSRGAWALTAVICLTIWLATSLAGGELNYFWPFWVIVPWGAAMGLRSITQKPQPTLREIPERLKHS